MIRAILMTMLLIMGLCAVEVDTHTRKLKLLPVSELYIDQSMQKGIEEIRNLKEGFQQNSRERLEYGYSPRFYVWVRFTLENRGDTPVSKLLVYDHPLTTDIRFYDGSKVVQEGLYHVPKHRMTLTPVFTLKVPPKSKKTYYLQLGSHILPLIVDLTLYDERIFIREESHHKMMLMLFFGAMGVLFVYNFFILLFTRDRSYFYYILYLFGVTLHHGLYTGVLYPYLPQEWITVLAIEGIYGVIALFLIGLLLFLRSFIQTSQYPRIDKVMSVMLLLIPLGVLGSVTGVLGQMESILFLLVGIYAVFVSVYAAFKKNRQAYFIVIGWVCIFSSFVVILMANNGLFNIFEHFRYTIEVGLALEAVIFSIALADRINQLQKQKLHLSSELIKQQKSEERRLSTLVEERTSELNSALHDKEVLFQELNHRVKNNMQTISSILRLQSRSTDDERVHNVCVTIQNRINAMKQLHELLHLQENISHINTEEYFNRLLEGIQATLKSDKNVKISCDIRPSLSVSDAITCGIILNELVTNSYKYAFEKEGSIHITLIEDGKEFVLSIQDDGRGYAKERQDASLGLKMVAILAEKQLRGRLETEHENGVKNTIRWCNAER